MFLAQQKLIWLASLISVFLVFYKLKSGYFLHRPKATLMMAYGCCLLMVGTITGLAGNMGLLGAGYSQSTVFFVIESIIGYIGGWVLIIWGMALWLPYLFSVSTRLQRKVNSVRLYETISKLSAYGDASPATFRKIATAVMEHYSYQGVSLHVVDVKNQLSLFASVGLTDRSKKLISSVEDGLYAKVYKTGEIFQADDQVRIHPDIIIETTTGPVVDALAMPVDFGTKRVGVLTIYTDHFRLFSQEDLRVLEAVCANLGLAFYREGLQRSINSHMTFRDFVAVILKTSRSDDNLNTQIIRMGKLLKQLIKFDSIHLYLLGDGPTHILDFNLQNGGRVIVEKGYFNDSEYKPVRWVVANRRGITLPGEASVVGADFKPLKDSAVLFTPIAVSGKAVGVLSVSTDMNHKFSQNEIIAINAIASVLSGVILNEMNESMTVEALEKSGAIRYSLETAFNLQQSNNILRELAKIIVEKTPATFCRIMLLDNEKKWLQTAAICQQRQLLWSENSTIGLPLSDLYVHSKVIATGKPEIFNNNEQTSNISGLEAKLLLPKGISQAMIIPIIIERKTVGVVTLGESRNSARNELGPYQMVFASLLTTIISMSIWKKDNVNIKNMLADSNRLAYRRLRYYENQAESFRFVSGINSRINGPLAGILASCEYLKNRTDIEREEMEKYIDVINKNADKIHKLFSQFSEARRIIDTIGK